MPVAHTRRHSCNAHCHKDRIDRWGLLLPSITIDAVSGDHRQSNKTVAERCHFEYKFDFRIVQSREPCLCTLASKSVYNNVQFMETILPARSLSLILLSSPFRACTYFPTANRHPGFRISLTLSHSPWRGSGSCIAGFTTGR